MSNQYRFPYQRSRFIHLPYFYKIKSLALIKIGLVRADRVTKPEAFIDTGSQYCLFNGAYAKYLGIENFKDVTKEYEIPIMGIGGKTIANRAYFHKVDLLIYTDQTHLKRDKAVITKDIEVGFLEKEFDIGGILGVYGFLDRFIFTTNIPKGYFEIEPVFE